MTFRLVLRSLFLHVMAGAGFPNIRKDRPPGTVSGPSVACWYPGPEAFFCRRDQSCLSHDREVVFDMTARVLYVAAACLPERVHEIMALPSRRR